MNSYEEAHLYVAAIRVLSYQKGMPPSIEDLCAMLAVSEESALAVCRKLSKKGIVSTLDDPFTIKVTVADHLALETLPREEEKKDSLASEIARFQEKKKSSEEKVSAIQAEMERKRKEMLSDFEARFKKEIEKSSPK